MKKHDIENYKNDLLAIWSKQYQVTGGRKIWLSKDRDEVIAKLAARRNCDEAEALKILNYCRSKKLVIAKHQYSFYFQYSLNFAPVADNG